MKINLQFIADLQRISGLRDNYSVPISGEKVRTYRGPAGEAYYLVFDLAISREILKSDAFVAYDYFSRGLQKTFSSQHYSYLIDFFRHSPIFTEAATNLTLRREMFKLLDSTNEKLLLSKQELLQFLNQHKYKIRQPLDFAKLITIFCLSTMIVELIGINRSTAIKSLLLKSNIWVPYFAPQRHRQLERALKTLSMNSLKLSEIQDDAGRLKLLIAQSLIVMGFDPVVSAICASIQSKIKETQFAKEVFLNCPTTYISRLCQEYVTIGDYEFFKDSEVSLFLVPSATDYELGCPNYKNIKSSLAFGLGKHMCVGKVITLSILQLAQETLETFDSELIFQPSLLKPDGAFLAYQ